MVKKTRSLPDILALLDSGFTEETARSLYAQGEEIAIFVMMQLAALAIKTTQVSGVHPSEPSGSVAVFLKEPCKKRRKKPGAKPGHQGSRKYYTACHACCQVLSRLRRQVEQTSRHDT